MARLKLIIEYGFYLFVFLLPWQTRLIWRDSYLNGYVWEYGRFSLYGTEILFWLVIFCYLLWLVGNKKLSPLSLSQLGSQLKSPQVVIYWLVVLLAVWAGLGVVWSLSSQLAYYRWIVLLEAVAVIAVVLNLNFSTKRLAAVWLSAASIQSVMAVWQFGQQLVWANKWLGMATQFPNQPGSIILQTTSERWLRAYGSLPHPNILAGWLVIALMFLFYLAFTVQTKSWRIFILTNLVLIVPALFFTFSRSAWIGLIVALVLLGFWLRRCWDNNAKKIFYQLIFLMLIILTLLSLVFKDLLLTRLTGAQQLEANSIELRLAFTQQARELIANDWLTGTGIGNYTLGVFQQLNATWPGYYYQPVHNIYLLVVSELGLIGGMIFAAIIAGWCWLVVRQQRSALNLEKVIIGLNFLIILIISLFDHYFWSLYFGLVVFWLILAFNLKLYSTGLNES